MVASKVTISQETRAKLDSPILTPKKRRELRQRLIVDHIRGHKGLISKQQLIAAAGLNPNARTMDYQSGLNMIKTMIKRGVILHNETPDYYKKWSVTEDVKARASKRQGKSPIVIPAPAQIAESVMPKAIVVELQDFKILDKLTLLEMAKEFAWKQNSDSLRQFIIYIENAIK